MNRRKRIGILAGMGPRSTAPFLELVYDECRRVAVSGKADETQHNH